MHTYPQNDTFLDHNLKLHKMIEMYSKYDNMHTNRILNALIYINNYVNLCTNCVLSRYLCVLSHPSPPLPFLLSFSPSGACMCVRGRVRLLLHSSSFSSLRAFILIFHSLSCVRAYIHEGEKLFSLDLPCPLAPLSLHRHVFLVLTSLSLSLSLSLISWEKG